MNQPGWYPNPDGTPNTVRYWNGTAWTDHVQPTQAAGGGAPAGPVTKRTPWVPIAAGLAVLALIVAAVFGSGVLTQRSATPAPAPAPTRTTSPVSTPTPTASQRPSAKPSPTPSIARPTAAPSSGLVIPTCPAASSGTLTDGYATLTIPQGWQTFESPEWGDCGGSAGRSVTNEWGTLIQIASIDPRGATAKDLAEELWEYNVDTNYRSSGTVTPAVAARVASVTLGRPSYQITGSVRVSGVAGVQGDDVKILVIEQPEGQLTAILSVATIGDAANASEAQSAWASLRVR